MYNLYLTAFVLPILTEIVHFPGKLVLRSSLVKYGKQLLYALIVLGIPTSQICTNLVQLRLKRGELDAAFMLHITIRSLIII